MARLNTPQETNCERERKLGIQYGWEPIPRQNEKYFCDFRRGHLYLWLVVRHGRTQWAVAELLSGSYQHHRYYGTLGEALSCEA